MPYYLTRKIRELKFEEYAFLFVVIVVVVYAMNRVKLFRIGWKYQFKTDEIFYGVKILLLQKKCIRETSIIAFQNFVSLSRTNVLTFIDKYRGKASKLIDKLNLKSEIQSHVRDSNREILQSSYSETYGRETRKFSPRELLVTNEDGEFLALA